MTQTITKQLSLSLFALVLAAGLLFGGQAAHAQGDDMNEEEARSERIASLLERVQELTQLINNLKEQIQNTRGDIREARVELRSELRQGMNGEEIREIQEVLATDPDIYPEGLTTGYFGPLTSRALERFQNKFELQVTGTVDEETREALEELLSERFGDGRVPPGLLRAPGIMKKVQERLRDRDREQFCDDDGNLRARGLLCPRDDDDEDDEDEDDEELKIEVEIEDGEAKVEIEYADGSEEEFTLELTDTEEIIDAIVEETDLDRDDVEDAIEFENKDEQEDEAMDEAESAIDDATDTIADAEADIDDTEGDTAGVEAMLADAEEMLDDAQEAFDDEDYEEATELAEDAEELADDIRDVLDGDDDDRIVMITVTVGDDDAEVETETNDGETDTFTVEETDEDAITAEVADETGLPESYVGEIIDFE